MSHSDHDKLSVFMREVMTAKFSGDYEAVNEVFDGLTMQDSPMVIVGYLRDTFSIRNHITNWQPSLVRAYDELERRDFDAARMLRGLF